MNMQNLMAQAQKMQKEITDATKQLESMTFEEKTGVVNVEVNGKKEVLKISINEDIDDKEMLEDMILTALNNAFKKVDYEKSRKLGKYSNAMGGLM